MIKLLFLLLISTYSHAFSLNMYTSSTYKNSTIIEIIDEMGCVHKLRIKTSEITEIKIYKWLELLKKTNKYNNC